MMVIIIWRRMMEIQVPIEKLREKKLFVATPMYGGQCAGMFAKSTNDLSALCTHYGIQLRYYYLFNESLITRARNYCVDEFMRSDYTHLMFIDSDIGFDPRDVLSMLALADGHEDTNDGQPLDIICGPYPKKTISWEKIKQAVDKGVADEDPSVLENYVGDFVLNPAEGNTRIALSKPAEVLEGGTGFMMIRKQTFEVFAEKYPELMYKPDHIRTEAFDGSREIMCFFDALIDPKSKRYLSEDYMFCQWSRNVGLKVWMCPWMTLKHVGSYVFGGNLQALASVGASATADPNKLKKKKESK